ncbi:long-chain-fatty-acid--CoA ligase [Gandjariella thermophila]|uniref:Acyl-CoA synthetase n=1 Tax=Gandjariella thermophila TaxID=1931992 RepID=A0A4D4IZU4_9PSEU|nr:long-chain-fatty-acid--CoA ligase [Gandjariella thermophila]GDY29771.1 acyl-CoA synthetase [Gandjariella thermophila]
MVDGTPTVTELLLARTGDEHPGLRFEESTWSWAEHVAASAERAALLRALRCPGIPFHVGVLLDNVPEFSLLLGAAALAGAVLVGLNPTRRGPALARDVRLADCQLVVTERRHAPLLDGLDLGAAVWDIDSPAWADAVAAHTGAPADAVPAGPDDLLMLIFTSGTSGDPKAVRCTHGKIAFPGVMLADRFGLSTADTVYVSMPMFHSNAIMAGWSVGLAAGTTIALRRRFSASAFLADVRRFGATYANYVGRPLSYLLATPERPDDADNPLRIVYGNEGAERDMTRFAERFGCHVVDGFGSTEGGVAVQRTPDTPPGALGRLADGVDILHPDTGEPCPPARFDADGRILNGEEAVGELVNTAGAGAFAGYYRDPDADAARLRGGRYWSGDLAYRDEDGFCYFAGRSADWLRVDGENLGTAPIERLLLRHPDVAEVAVYAVPDVTVGDQIMAALVLRDGAAFDPDGFVAFLAAQPDLGAKQLPRYVRIATELPRTSTYKVLKRQLAAERWNCPDPVWHREGHERVFRRLTPARAAELEEAVAAHPA